MKKDNQSKPLPSVENDLILSYSILTYDNRVRHLAKLKRELKEEDEKMIYEIIKKHKCNTTREVFDIFKNIVDKKNEKIKLMVQEKYENDEIDWNQKNEYIKTKSRNPLTLRTIQNIINRLEQKGKLIKKEKRKFDLKEGSDVDIEYIRQEYSKAILGKSYDLSKDSPEDLVEDLVHRFGLIMLWFFILNYKEKKNDTLDIDTYEYTLSNWLIDKMPLYNMYEVFRKSVELIKENRSNEIKSDDVVCEILLKKAHNFNPSIYSKLVKINKSFEPGNNMI